MLEVVAALIIKDGRLMICQRPNFKSRPLLWEFPGGKVEENETKEQALKRECKEELDISIEVTELYTEVIHTYPDVSIHLSLFKAHIEKGEPRLIEHNDLQWITLNQLDKFNFCPADKTIIEKLKRETAL